MLSRVLAFRPGVGTHAKRVCAGRAPMPVFIAATALARRTRASHGAETGPNASRATAFCAPCSAIRAGPTSNPLMAPSKKGVAIDTADFLAQAISDGRISEALSAAERMEIMSSKP